MGYQVGDFFDDVMVGESFATIIKFGLLPSWRLFAPSGLKPH